MIFMTLISRVWYIVLLTTFACGSILRLPCKKYAAFKVIFNGKRLTGNVLASFYGLQDAQCMVKCIENAKCRSYNTNMKNGRCEVNGKTIADSGATLEADSDWVYKSTDYSSNLVGPVCTALKPCGDRILCKDSCDPPYYKCVYCDADHEGLHCDVAIDRNECSSNPCQNSGTCVDKLAGYQCMCWNGFTGKNCEVDIDECMSLPCFNGGSCINEIGNYTCNCTTAIGYEGRNCERETDECSSNPCQNSGTCVDKFADYQCTCLNGYTGKDCEIDIDECLNSPCFNGGSCINEFGNYTCNCTNAIGYAGRHCEIDIDECAKFPCMNGGHCINSFGQFACICPVGFSGKICDSFELNIRISSYGKSDPGYGGARAFKINGAFAGTNSRGFNVLVLSHINGLQIGANGFDTYGKDDAGSKMVEFIEGFPNGSILLLAAMDSAHAKLSQQTKDYLSNLGSVGVTSIHLRSSLALLTAKGRKPTWFVEKFAEKSKGPSIVQANLKSPFI